MYGPEYLLVADMLTESELQEIRERQAPGYRPFTFDDILAAHEQTTVECIQTISHGMSLFTKLKEAHRNNAGMVASCEAIISIERLNLNYLRKELKDDRQKRKRFKNV